MLQSAVELVHNYVHANDLIALSELSAELHSGQLTLLTILQGAEDAITNPDSFIRSKATELLCELLNGYTDKLTAAEGKVIGSFLKTRLESSLEVEPAITQLLALLKNDLLEQDLVYQVVEQIDAEINVQSHKQHCRKYVLEYLLVSLRHHRAAFVGPKSDRFVAAVIRCVDGENDPRNLVVTFRLVSLIAEKLDIEKFADDLFEITFCYFPITFQPASDDPHGITTEDLKDGLATCLCHKAFAKPAIPALLAKLASAATFAKKDSMEMFKLSLPIYGPDHLTQHAPELWEILHEVLYESTSAELEPAALQVLTTMLRSLSTSTIIPQVDALAKIMESILEEGLEALRDAETKNARLTAKVWSAAAASCLPACDLLVKHALGKIITLFWELPAGKRLTTLSTCVEILRGCVTLEKEGCRVNLSNHSKELLDVMLTTATADNDPSHIRKNGIQGLKELLLSRCLEREEMEISVERLTDMFLLDESEDVQFEAISAVIDLSQDFEQMVETICIPRLFDLLPTREQLFEQDAKLGVEQGVPLRKEIQLLSLLCENERVLLHLTERLLRTVVPFIDEVAKSPSIERFVEQILSVFSEERNFGPETAETILRTLVQTLPLRNLGALTSRVLDAVGSAMGTSLRSLSTDAQQQALPALLWRENPIVAMHVLANLRKDVSLDLDLSLEQYTRSLIESARSCRADRLTRTRISQASAVFINKFFTESQVRMFFSKDPSLARVPFHMDPDGWVYKGLVLRLHPIGFHMAKRMIDALAEDGSVLEVLKLGTKNCGKVFSKAAHSRIRPLHKQRLVLELLPAIIKGYKYASKESQPRYLQALAIILRDVPRQVLRQEASTVLPLLLASLAQDQSSPPDTRLLHSTLNIFALVIGELPELISRHSETLLETLKVMILPPYAPSLRAAALDCLMDLSDVEGLTNETRRKVIKDVEKALDDGKRIVRRRAVECLSRWYEVAAKS